MCADEKGLDLTFYNTKEINYDPPGQAWYKVYETHRELNKELNVISHGGEEERLVEVGGNQKEGADVVRRRNQEPYAAAS